MIWEWSENSSQCWIIHNILCACCWKRWGSKTAWTRGPIFVQSGSACLKNLSIALYGLSCTFITSPRMWRRSSLIVHGQLYSQKNLISLIDFRYSFRVFPLQYRSFCARELWEGEISMGLKDYSKRKGKVDAHKKKEGRRKHRRKKHQGILVVSRLRRRPSHTQGCHWSADHFPSINRWCFRGVPPYPLYSDQEGGGRKSRVKTVNVPYNSHLHQC